MIVLVMVCTIGVYGQQVVASGGQSGNGNQIQASATIGEAIIGSGTNGDLNSNQGFQQPLTSDITSTVEISPGVHIEFTVGPNPAVNQLNFTMSETMDCQLLVIDLNGRLIKKVEMTQQKVKHSFDLTTWQSTAYIIQIRSMKGRALAAIPFIKI